MKDVITELSLHVAALDCDLWFKPVVYPTGTKRFIAEVAAHMAPGPENNFIAQLPTAIAMTIEQKEGGNDLHFWQSPTFFSP